MISLSQVRHLAVDRILRDTWPDHDFETIMPPYLDESIVLVWPRSDPQRVAAFNGFVGEWAVNESASESVEGFRRGFQAAVDAVPA